MARYPSGKIPRKSKEYGRTFVCRRGCNTRTSTYTQEFNWEDIHHSTEEEVQQLIDQLEIDTKGSKTKRPQKRIKDEEDFAGDFGGDYDIETPRKKQKISAISTPRKLQTPSKLLTPSHKRFVLHKSCDFFDC
jgi:origin recognition complex subunit 1